MSSIFSHIRTITTKYPLLRGVLSYSVIWPASALIQQSIAGKTWENYDWKKCLRFSLYGALFVAPSLYAWVRLSTIMWPRTSLKTGLCKAFVEQISYTPAAMVCFYYFMSLLEGKSTHEAANEVSTKFLPTYKVAVCVWPIVATINFSFVPERNRVPFVSACSLIWTCFLAYMKQLEQHDENSIKVI